MRARFFIPLFLASSAAIVVARGADHEREVPVEIKSHLTSETRAHVTFVPRSIESYAGLAHAFVEADITRVQTLDIAGQLPRTEYELRIVACHLGDVPSTVHVQVAGGRTKTRSFVVEGAPSLSVGDRGLFFLGGETEGGALSFLGLENGCYAIESVGDLTIVKGGEHANDGVELGEFVSRVQDGYEAFLAKEVR